MSNEPSLRSPRLARRLLGLLVPDEYQEAMLGDLEEAYVERCDSARFRVFAAAWYWTQVVHIDVVRLRREARSLHRAERGRGDMVDMLVVELKQAVRVFRKNPGFVSAVVLTLAVGIGGATSVFSLVNGLLLRPIAGVEDASTLAAVRASQRGGAFGVAAYVDFLDLRERSRSFDGLAAFKPRDVDASAAGKSQPLPATMVTSAYFEVLGVEPSMGRFFSPEIDVGPGAHPEVVLTHGLWQTWFASDPSVLGRDMVLNGQRYTVVGVSPPGFGGTLLADVQLFVPMTMQAALMPQSGYLLENRGWGGIEVVGRLAEGVGHSSAAEDVGAIGRLLADEYPRTNGERAYTAIPFREAALPGEARTGVFQLSVLLMAIVGALWLVVCLNVANLFLARSLKRRQELAVRLAMGAGRSRVTRQLILEFMTIAVVAGSVGLVLARAIAGAVATLPIPILFDTSLDIRTVSFGGALAVASGLLCALVPALTMSGTDPRTVAAPAPSLRPRRPRWPSRVMVISQVTLSVVLLFTTGLFVRTFSNLTSADPGFDSENLITARFNPLLQGYDTDAIADYYTRLGGALMDLPGVAAVTMADGLPSANDFGSDSWFLQSAESPEQSSSFSFSAVAPSFFGLMQIPIVAGRGFDQRDTPGQPPSLIVNEAAGRLIEARTGRPPVGQQIGPGGPDGPFFAIVGVVGDSRTGRAMQASPFVYGAHAQALALGFGGTRMVVMLKTSVRSETLAADFRRVAAAVDPNVSASNVITMDRFLDELLVADRLTVRVLGISSALALLLVAIGLYGLLAYVVAQRTREFGIRLALGAGAANLKTIVVREALALAGAGVVFGVLGALAVTRLTESFLVGVAATDPVSLGGSLAAVIAVTLAAAYVPAARAMRADPVVAMRVD